MAADAFVYTLARVALMLGESEELLEEIATDMDPEHGSLGVIGVGEEETTAFTSDGIDYIRDVLPDYKNRD